MINNNIYDTLLVSPSIIKSMGELDVNVDDSVIVASIRVAQNIYLEEVIGSKLMLKIKELVFNAINNKNDNINEEKYIDFKTLLDVFIRDVISYKVASEMCVRNTLKLKNMGVVQLGDTNINTVSLSDIKYLKDSFDTYYNSALNKMMNFINSKKNTFKDYLYIDCNDNNNTKYGNINLFLG